MPCIAIASRSPERPGAVQLRKLVAGGEIPDTGMCSAPGGVHLRMSEASFPIHPKAFQAFFLSAENRYAGAEGA